MVHLAIIADDLTGAADTGACFADAGFSTVIPFARSSLPPADVLVLSTESREMTPTAVAAVVALAVAGLAHAPGAAPPRWIYKKMDSALRGHAAAELFATLTAVGATRALVAPAFPAEGRTTVGGCQFVAGEPLASSAFGAPATGSHDPSLIARFANDHGLPVHHLDLALIRTRPDHLAVVLDDPAPGIMVADAETDEDLLLLARAAAASSVRVFSGAAGFARQLATVLPMRPTVASRSRATPSANPVLVIAGSRHPATARQLAALTDAGAAIIVPPEALLDDPGAPIEAVVREVVSNLKRGRTTALTTVGLHTAAAGAATVATRLAAIGVAAATTGRPGALALTGGDVAASVCARLGATALWLHGEITAGLPWGVLDGGLLPGLPVATKAGSFGREDALMASVAHLMTIARRTLNAT